MSRFTDMWQREGVRGILRRTGEETAALADLPWRYGSRYLPGHRNGLELRVIAMRRSGHHAVLNWIRWQSHGHHLFLNDGEPCKNPFATCSHWSSRVGIRRVEHRRIPWKQECQGEHTRRGTLIYSYEERDCDEVVGSPEDEARREKWIGSSGRRHDVLILRDPFNLMASRTKWADASAEGELAHQTMATAMPLWKAHAREFLGITKHLPQPFPISYNHWFTDREYRRDLADRLALNFTDEGIGQVARWGPTMSPGYSFDGVSLDGKAQQMKVLDRWRNYWDRPEFRAHFDDEVRELSDRIFGPILDD